MLTKPETTEIEVEDEEPTRVFLCILLTFIVEVVGFSIWLCIK